MVNLPNCDLHLGDCLDVMGQLPECSVDTIVTDPPYGLQFMGKGWDHGVPGEPFWRAALRVAKPGAMMLAFGGTRTWHRLAVAIEDAGWILRDTIMWMHGCLSDDTEILVDGEWVPYHKAIAGRLAMCYDPVHDEFSWQPISALHVYAYSDTAYRIHSDSTDQIVSKGHRCLVERCGNYEFAEAWAVAPEREAGVPVLEGVSGLLADLPVPDQRAGGQEQVLRSGVCNANDARPSTADASGTERDVFRLWDNVSPTTFTPCSCCESDLLQALQRGSAGQRVGSTRVQGESGLDRRVEKVMSREDDRAEQSGMEGWGDLHPQARELSSNQVCPVPGRVSGHGPQGRLRDGASLDCRDGDREAVATFRGGASHESQSAGQPGSESVPVRQQQRPQAVRASRYTRSDLARIEPVQYTGIVWCVTVPTGAFVARRNGKVFVTGNSGFPKSHNISKAIDAAAGAERPVVGSRKLTGTARCKGQAGGYAATAGRADKAYATSEIRESLELTTPATDLARQWDGWGTALKPAFEPVIMAMKPLDGTFAENAAKWGVAGLWIDGGRIPLADGEDPYQYPDGPQGNTFSVGQGPDGSRDDAAAGNEAGRWPANVILDEGAAAMLDAEAGECASGQPSDVCGTGGIWSAGDGISCGPQYGDSGGPSRFFYCGKASRREREDGCEGLPPTTAAEVTGREEGSAGLAGDAHGGTTGNPRAGVTRRGAIRNFHPTVKPIDLMRYLVRLTRTPAGGSVLDPFMGSGTTGIACVMEDRPFIGIELNEEYLRIAEARIRHAIASHQPRLPGMEL